MNIRQLIGIVVILAAYGLTWYFLLKSLSIVRIIDREGLKHAPEIKARLKRRGKPDKRRADKRSGQDAPGESGEAKDTDPRSQRGEHTDPGSSER
ncbi:MAG: hypothetical protein JSV89_13355 [Spirochaetaceae bacterium]|nr:MAG: hypothetical protein JSV89_13355 [Spirochaetaceae bacterium]